MSEFDELVASPGVFMAGRFGPDGRIAEYKSKSLYVANPASAAMTQWFCAARRAGDPHAPRPPGRQHTP
jgi:roadblock/LC7 domain-containing protein